MARTYTPNFNRIKHLALLDRCKVKRAYAGMFLSRSLVGKMDSLVVSLIDNARQGGFARANWPR